MNGHSIADRVQHRYNSRTDPRDEYNSQMTGEKGISSTMNDVHISTHNLDI